MRQTLLSAFTKLSFRLKTPQRISLYRMSTISPRKLSDKIIQNFYADLKSSETHLSIENGQNPISNSHSDSNMSESHIKSQNPTSQMELNQQIQKLLNGMIDVMSSHC